MRVLFLTPFLPWPLADGGRIRMFKLAAGVAREHEVEVLSVAHAGEDVGAAAAALRDVGVRLQAVRRPGGPARDAAVALLRRGSLYDARHWSPLLARRLAERLARRDAPNLVHAEYSYMGQYRRRVPTARAVPWVLDEHNLEFLITERLTAASGGSAVYRLYAHRERRHRRAEELAACQAADRVLTVSDTDADALRALLPGLRCRTVPNGVDLDDGPPTPAPAEPPGLVFVGKLSYRPNVDGITWFVRDVLPRVRRAVPEVRLTVVGSDPPGALRALAAEPGVEVVGWVDDVRAAVRAGTVSVVPLLAGSGTRLKILESLALNRAVVSTTIGAEGLDPAPGRDLEIADGAAAFADAVVGLLRDRDRRERLAGSGRQTVEDRYGWEVARAALLDEYRALLPAR